MVVDRGPGLFTGLRVGLATALGLSEGTGCAAGRRDVPGALGPRGARGGYARDPGVCVDGRRGEIFVQNFHLDDEVTALNQPSVAVARAWSSSGPPMAHPSRSPATASSATRGISRRCPTEKWSTQLVPSITAALRLGAEREPVAQVEPLYLREADAVANFSTRQRS